LTSFSRFCIELNSKRTKQTATEELFSAVAKYAADIPIIIVATKMDEFKGVQWQEGRRIYGPVMTQEVCAQCDEYAADQVSNQLQQIEREMREVDGGRFDASVPVAQG
jgi:hypothetical protein